MVETAINQNICTPYVNNPYVCPCAVPTNIVVPQGQIMVPAVPAQPLRVVNSIPQNQQNVNYNQVTPYINTNSKVFQPAIQTQSGKAIANVYNVNPPLTNDESQIVYQGPIKDVNPQITPKTQTDTEIENDFRSYFKTKAKENPELNSALNKTFGEEKGKKLPLFAKILGAVIIVGGLYKYRAKIPLLNKIHR